MQTNWQKLSIELNNIELLEKSTPIRDKDAHKEKFQLDNK